MPSEKQIRTTINFVLVVVALNWLTFQVQKINQHIVNQDYEKIMNAHHREVFHSFAGIMLVQKAFACGFGLLILFLLKKISDQTDSNRNENQGEKNDTKSEISDEQIKTSSPKQQQPHEFNETITQQLQKTQNKTSLISISNKDGFTMGILLFVSSIIISEIQRKITFIFIISFKYIGMLVFFCVFHFIIQPKIRKQGFQAKGFVKKMLLMIAVSGSGCAAKILGELYGFYMANAGMVDVETQISGIFGLVLVIILDFLLYTTMNKLKYSKPGLTTLELMTSLAMWTSIFYLIYSICVSEFGYTISFIFDHPQIIYSLLRFSFVNFWIQFLIYFSFLSYEPHIFISIIASRGMFSNPIPDMFKYLTIMSVFYYVACFGLIYFAIQLAKSTQKIGTKKKSGNSFENSYNEVQLEEMDGNQSTSQEKQNKI